jgi:hypothetical protein
MAPFSLFLWHVKLIATIVELYGHASHAKAVDDAISPSNESTSMENESKILLSRLSYFITEACDKIRDSGTFEVCTDIGFFIPHVPYSVGPQLFFNHQTQYKHRMDLFSTD